MTKSILLTNSNGLKFNAVIMYDGLKVEFYDDRFKGILFDPEFGQFVSRYYIETLTRDSASLKLNGLNLDGGIDEWSIDSDAMKEFFKFLKS